MTYLNDLDGIVQRLDRLKTSLVGKRILVTGGTGFLGKWLVDALSKVGARPVVISRQRPASAGGEWFEGNLLDPSLFRRLSGNDSFELKFDEAIHAANDFSLTAEQAVAMAKQVFDLAKAGRARRVLFLSSGAVYQASVSQPTQFLESETLVSDVSALPAYASGKVRIEQEGLARAQRGDFEFKIIRGFAFLGPHQILDSHFAASQFFKAWIHQQPLSVQDGGQAVRSYLYPTDFVLAALLILFRGKPSQVYNLGSKETVRIIDLARAINLERPSGTSEIIDLPSKTPSLSQFNRYVPDLTRIETEFNFQLQVPLKEAIARTAKFYRETQLINSHSLSLLRF